MRMTAIALGIAASALSTLAQAGEEVPEALETLSFNGQEVTPSSVEPAPVDGWFAVALRSGERFYTDAEGRYMMVGSMFENTEHGLVNLSERTERKTRREALAEVPEESRLAYPAADEKHTITVFTDPTCPYCQQLHGEIAELNAQGVTVEYIPFPRGGLGTGAAHQLAGVWCSDDRQQAMTATFQGGQPEPGDEADLAACEAAVERGFMLGQRFGVRGTPAIVLPSGELGQGYVPAGQLVQSINQSTQ